MKQTFLLMLMIFVMGSISAQTDTEPTTIKQFIKKEKGKVGIKDGKTWLVPAKYDKITGIQFGNFEDKSINFYYYKCWIGDKFDILYSNQPETPTSLKIILVDVSSLAYWNFYLHSKKGKVDQEFIYYQKEDKWGWFIRRAEITKVMKKYYVENFIQDARFDKTPELQVLSTPDYSEYNNVNFLVDSAGLKGLFSYDGKQLFKFGTYSRFKWDDQLKTIVITGDKDLKGYVFKGEIVEPQYSSIAKSKNIMADFECTTPDGKIEYRIGAKLASNENVASGQRYDKFKKEADEKRRAENASNNKQIIDPFEIIKYVRNGIVKDLLIYTQTCGLNYTKTVKDGNDEYMKSGTAEAGPATIIDSKKDGIAVTYEFKDYSQKKFYKEKLLEEGFEVIEMSTSSAKLRKDGVDIWFLLGSFSDRHTWIISKTSP